MKINLIVKSLFDLILIIVVGLPIVILKILGKTFQRGFFCDDSSIRYPYVAVDTISTLVNFAVACVMPIITIFLVELFRTYYFESKWLDRKLEKRQLFGNCQCPVIFFRLYYYFGYFIFGCLFTFTLTDIMKHSIGRLRPHFIAVCQPDWLAFNCSQGEYILQLNCTSNYTKKVLNNARLSFPSGHSSTIWYGMIFVTLYIERQMMWPMISGALFKGVMQLACVCIAIVISLSRISDYRHHWEDVIGGSILGIAVGYITVVHFTGLFRFPKRPVIFSDVVASDAQSLKQHL